MLAANGLGNLLSKYITLSEPVIKILSDDPEENVIIFKIFIFVVMVLVLVLKGSFDVDIGRRDPLLTRFVITSVFGILSAGLIMSTVILFVAGAEVGADMTEAIQEALRLPDNTLFVHYFFRFYSFWFAAPAIAFVAISVFSPFSPPPIIDDSI